MAENGSYEIDDNLCIEHPPIFLEFKMVLVGCIGTTIALISFIENILVFYTFVHSKVLQRRNLLYLTCLSLCDIFVGVSYIGIMSMQVYADYFRCFTLFELWHEYLRVVFTVSHITLSTASFLIMAAAIERYLQVCSSRISLLGYVCRHRTGIVVGAFLLGLLLRGTVFFEIQIYHVDECEGFASMGVELTALARNRYFDGIWRFWTRKITTVFLPFFVLAYCNAAIVYNLQKSERNRMVRRLILNVTLGPNAEPLRLKSRLKTATRMLIMVVTCYLCANIIDVFIAAWEHIDGESLMQFGEFYTLATDVASLLSVLAASLRLPIYVINDAVIRKEVANVICSLISRLKTYCPLTAILSQSKKKQVNFSTRAETPKAHLIDERITLTDREGRSGIVRNT
uniref:G-protein coupled receptors family 1 profile domain-containing protein n=1 Tax=Parascaris equorum TaxID=6256 RepID=A0A914RWF9_PAREQ